jgi:transposase-like protein
MEKYSKERKEALIKKMMPPCNKSISQLSEESGIPKMTLYTWRKKTQKEGKVVPGNGKMTEKWSSEEKFRVVLTTSPMNEIEQAEYCRKKGLYVEQVTSWRDTCMFANSDTDTRKKGNKDQSKYQKKIRDLERELLRKEKALAETAALLVLRKKASAIWGEEEDA